ncbi:MAG: type II toxin-antitoxin system PemK/MazF family toxin [Myxococcaceae bacterium]
MTRGEIYRTRTATAERGDKPGFYVVVSRAFVAENDDISTVICAPVYSEVLGLATEVVLEPAEGVRKRSAIRCDFLALMFKRHLTQFVATLSPARLATLDQALAVALDLNRGDRGLPATSPARARR